jgi:hypothetical protein
MEFDFILYARWGDRITLPVNTIPALLDYVETDEFVEWLLARYARARLTYRNAPTHYHIVGRHGPELWGKGGPPYAEFRLFSELPVDKPG